MGCENLAGKWPPGTTDADQLETSRLIASSLRHRIVDPFYDARWSRRVFRNPLKIGGLELSDPSQWLS